MMHRPDHDQELEDVLDAYVAETETPDHAALVQWIQRYPRYARQLADFSASWSLTRTLETPDAEFAEEKMVQQGMRAVRALVQRTADPASVATPLAALLDEGRARGLSIQACLSEQD